MNRLFLLFFGAVTLVARAQVPNYVPTEGLVAWYPFNGNANDESGNGNDGVVHGATLTADRFMEPSMAYSFDGSNDMIACGNAPSVQISGALTYSAWIRLDNYTNFSGIVGRGEGTGGTKAISMLMVTNSESKSLRFEISDGSPYESVSSPDETILRNVWTHVVGVWYGPDADSMTVFIDGQLSVSAPSVTNEITGGTDAADNLLKIGNRDTYNNGNSYGWFDGKIDDVGVWSRGLTSGEILALYNAEPPVPGCTDPTACNYDAQATSDDGNCIPSGCMEPEACNYNALAECEGEACDYSCCPGPGCCGDGMYWDYETSQCAIIETCEDDLDGDGVIGVNDLMQLLSSFGTDCPVMFTCGDPVNYHGHDYATVQIGGQCWFAENLATASYRNGEGIAGGFDNEQWAELTEPGQSVLDNLEANADVYGRFYNWFAVNDERRLCPMDWHLPTHTEWNELTEYLGGVEVTGGRLKSSTNDEIQWNGTNDVGFGALPNGYRNNDDGEFLDFGETTIFWASTEAGASSWYRMLQSYTDWILSYSNGYFSNGYSVRCIKD